MKPELVNLVAVSLVLLGVVGTAEALRRLGLEAELTRKLVHVGSGVVAGSFPWLFRSAWSVAGLASVFMALMVISGRAGGLRSIHGVRRPTAGALCFPIAVAVAFAAAGDRPHAYLPALLVLALSDSAAVWVGRARGRTRYRVGTSVRSLEGSIAFLLCSLPCVLVPLLLFTRLSLSESLAWTVTVALLATCVEALSGGGTDNLTVPVTVTLGLLRVDSHPAAFGSVVVLLAFAVTAFVLLVRPSPPLCSRRVPS